nr:uncharacterized protein LOC109776755 [Aegilops tauschii subsp. strangulata]
MGKDIVDFDLPSIDDTFDPTGGEAREVIVESTVEFDVNDTKLASSRKFKQRVAYDEILACGTAKLLRMASLILWDEATMTKPQAVEALDNNMHDIMGRRDRPFGGKTIVFGEDFRHVLPVVRRGSQGQIVDATLQSSHLWKGEVDNLEKLIDHVFPSLDDNMFDPNYMTSRAILFTTNDNVDKIIIRMIERFQGEEVIYHMATTLPSS